MQRHRRDDGNSALGGVPVLFGTQHIPPFSKDAAHYWMEFSLGRYHDSVRGFIADPDLGQLSNREAVGITAREADGGPPDCADQSDQSTLPFQYTELHFHADTTGSRSCSVSDLQALEDFAPALAKSGESLALGRGDLVH